MKQIKLIIVILSFGFMLASCASPNYLNKTVWVNTTPVEKEGIKGNILTSAYFWDKKTVSFYTAVEKDGEIIVQPVLYALGKYKCQGKLENGAKVTTHLQTTENESISYEGVLIPEGMVLISQDSIAKGYSIIKDLKIE